MQEEKSSWIERWFALSGAARKSDAIFVLAAARERNTSGLELYRQGLAQRILGCGSPRYPSRAREFVEAVEDIDETKDNEDEGGDG